MAYVYRYIDLVDNKIKYVGIVWSENRTLEQRILEHNKNDEWTKGRFKIEYITEDINTRTDAEYFESHYISLFGTDKYYNVKKAGWGVSSFLPQRTDWKVFHYSFEDYEDETYQTVQGFFITGDTKEGYFEIYNREIKYSKCKKRVYNNHHCRICGSNNFCLERGDDGFLHEVCRSCGNKRKKKICKNISDSSIYDKNGIYRGGYVYNDSKIDEYNFYVSKGVHIGKDNDLYVLNKYHDRFYLYGIDKNKCLEVIKNELLSRLSDSKEKIKSYYDRMLNCNKFIDIVNQA